MSKTIGIIDEPVKPGAQDNLDINIHSKSLIDFISETSTPITVGIQGEWGSGKTSPSTQFTIILKVNKRLSRSG